MPFPIADNRSTQLSRKRKSNGGRVRVTRACDRCKKRKIKCNNTRPCQYCVRAKATCTFNSTYLRGRKPPIPLTRNGEERSNSVTSENMLSPSKSSLIPQLPQSNDLLATEISQNDPTSFHIDGRRTFHHAPSVSTDEGLPSRPSPEPSQTDLQGHYIGPASGVSFLLRIQKRLHQTMSFSEPSSIFTFGDAPLDIPEFDPSFCMMLPKDDARRLVDRYFDFAMPTYRFLHRPTVEEWFDEFYDTLGVMRDTNNAHAKVALLFMVFSLARVYMPDYDKPGPSDLSARYYLAAEHQLAKEKGSIRLTSVQARLTQCYYLLTQSRINHCWSLFGTVSRLALAIGLNTDRCHDAPGGISLIEVECRRRTFWCAYTLDVYLSAALGRPRSFHDEDINTELPACVEDRDLMSNHIGSPIPTSRPSTMLAPLAHMKLARIIGRILRNLYSIRPVSQNHRLNTVRTISRDLSDWRAELAWFLDADILNTSLLLPIFQRQRNVLNLTYWQAIILTHRPFVLSNFVRLSQQAQANSTHDNAQTEESVGQCLNASLKTVDIINDISENHQLVRALWITSYFAFNATVMLYIYVIQKRAFPSEVYSSYLSAATRCQSHLLAIAERGSLSERYCLVLEELRIEATRHTSDILSSTNPVEDGHDRPQTEEALQPELVTIENSSTHTVNCLESMNDVPIDFFNSIPTLSLESYAGWDHFTSMVSSGLGNMDVFPNVDSFRD
ncbi:fungal-specific transcription factor domain-containing protein [Aspergillus ambiguus]|uniref:Zn(II)2Cys6 transcription factor n=1 Tax=Aspergillus ambiguus TaxID=176160 RepID=UPI003CCCEC1B